MDFNIPIKFEREQKKQEIKRWNEKPVIKENKIMAIDTDEELPININQLRWFKFFSFFGLFIIILFFVSLIWLIWDGKLQSIVDVVVTPSYNTTILNDYNFSNYNNVENKYEIRPYNNFTVYNNIWVEGCQNTSS